MRVLRVYNTAFSLIGFNMCIGQSVKKNEKAEKNLVRPGVAIQGGAQVAWVFPFGPLPNTTTNVFMLVMLTQTETISCFHLGHIPKREQNFSCHLGYVA